MVSPPPPLLPLPGIIAIIIVYLVICYLIMDLISQDDYYDDDDDDDSSYKDENLSGLSGKELQEVPCFYYIVNIMGQTSACAICLDSFKNEELCRIFPNCTHVFHAHCVDLWLVRRLTCPTCRTPFLVRCS